MDSPLGKPTNINPDNISYGYESFKGFDVRQVFVNGDSKSEYHLKSDPAIININVLLDGAKKILGNDCEIGLVDPTLILTLDFPIFVIVKNPMIEDIMSDIWIDLENLIK